MLSGALAGVAALAEVLFRRRHFVIDASRVATAVGVIFSAVIFAALIAPASPTGTWFQPWDDLWVRVATALFHAVAPVLIATDFVLRPPALSLPQWIAAACSLPLTYLAFLAVAASVFSLHISRCATLSVRERNSLKAREPLFESQFHPFRKQ